MNIQAVASNLRSTIADKEAHLARLHEDRKSEDAHVRMVSYAFIKVLEINIDELKRVLVDVEHCVSDYVDLKQDLKEANGRVRQLEQQASYNLDGPIIKMFRED